MIPARVAEFREKFRREEIPSWYRGRVHFAFTSIVSLSVIAGAIALLDAPTALEWATVPVTFLFANFVEYRGHRGPMHHATRGLAILHRRHTLQHHHFFTHDAMWCEWTRDYKIMLFPSYLLLFFIGLHAVPVGALLFLVAGVNVGSLFTAVAVGYYLTYEWLHFSYHLPPDSFVGRMPLVAALRRHHRKHHDLAVMQTHNFNITFPICDWIFGTTWREPKAVPEVSK